MINGSYSMNNVTGGGRNWYLEEFSGYPIIYPITIYHIYPTVLVGRIVHVVWYIVGFLGNVLSLRIWTLQRVRRVSQSAPYLICLTLSDLLYQTMHIFYYLKYFWGLKSLGLMGLCQTWNVLNLVPQYASQLLVFGFTTERFIAVLRPFSSERFSKSHRTPAIVGVILFATVAVSSPQGMFWTVNSDGFCEIRTENLFVSVYGYWTIVTESLIFIVFPLITLIFNIVVLRQVYKSVESIELLDARTSKRMRVHKRCSSYKPATRALMVISCFRILSQLPISITYALQNFEQFNFGQQMPLDNMSLDPQWNRFLHYWSVRMLVETAGASHHALGIFIYYVSTRPFKTELLSMLGLRQRKAIRRQKVRYHSSSENGIGVRSHRTNTSSV